MKKGDFAMADLKKGFTFVEVSLVLAIAGLIFLMVFIALPSVQRTQRDAEREENISSMLQALKKYQTNNRGALPSDTPSSPVGYNASASGNTWAGFYKEYLGPDFTDPNGQNYNLRVMDCSVTAGECTNNVNGVALNNLENSDFAAHNYTVYILKHASCDGAIPIGVENPRRVAAVYKIEGAGAYCANT